MIFEALNAHQRTAALKTAIELGLFRAVGDGEATSAALATRCEASERGIRILCDYLTIDVSSKSVATNTRSRPYPPYSWIRVPRPIWGVWRGSWRPDRVSCGITA
jgi:hypothetical protein